jgi:hypothetical protein
VGAGQSRESWRFLKQISGQKHHVQGECGVFQKNPGCLFKEPKFGEY